VRRFLLPLVVVAAAVAAPAAGASVIIDRSATNWTPADVHLTVNAKGEALVNYTEGGQAKHVLVWGAENALAPKAGGTQVAFQLDYAGGWGKYYVADPSVKGLQVKLNALKASGKGYLNSPEEKTLSAKANYAKNYWQAGFDGTCGTYDGPALAWFVEACKAPDGSYWALQSWQRQLPDYGVSPTASQAVWELHLSHWTGALPALTIQTDWSYAGKWNHLFGTFTYDGTGVAGFKATAAGVPLDTFGRNVYVDTYDSKYGTGWKRENSFLTHTGSGAFCYSINPHGAHPDGTGTMYRATIQGPGVLPDIMWQGNAPAAYSKDAQQQADLAILALHDPKCQPTDH
jgi:hypothetical protein